MLSSRAFRHVPDLLQLCLFIFVRWMWVVQHYLDGTLEDYFLPVYDFTAGPGLRWSINFFMFNSSDIPSPLPKPDDDEVRLCCIPQTHYGRRCTTLLACLHEYRITAMYLLVSVHEEGCYLAAWIAVSQVLPPCRQVVDG